MRSNNRNTDAPKSPRATTRPECTVPPVDAEAEAAVLGAVLLAPAWMRACRRLGLVAEDFYSESHRRVYRAICALEEQSRPIDHVTVAAQLALTGELDEVGGADYVAAIVERIPSIANTHEYVAIVIDNAKLRALIRVAQEIQEAVAGRTGTPDELIARSRRAVGELRGDRQRKTAVNFTTATCSWPAASVRL